MINVFNPLYLTDGYKPGHKDMLPPDTSEIYATWIPRSLKHAPEGITKITHFGSSFVWKIIKESFDEHFFFTEQRKLISNIPSRNSRILHLQILEKKALKFCEDLSKYLGTPYNDFHFRQLWSLGYLPLEVQALPEGIETDPNIPHMTFRNTLPEFSWLTLFLETTVSMLSWKISTSATIARQYRRVMDEWVDKTDKDCPLRDLLCHDFSPRGLDPFSTVASGLGFALFFKGSDNLAVIPALRKYYNYSEEEMPIFSVRATEHSVTCTNIFYYKYLLEEGNKKCSEELIKFYENTSVPTSSTSMNPDYLLIAEYLTIKNWITTYKEGVLSIVSDTFDLWKVLTEILPRLKEDILSRNGKIVIRPDSGDPVDIICGELEGEENDPKHKGAIELLWDVFGGTVNDQGYKVLDPHIGLIYGDSITLKRQEEIYKRLADKGFAVSNVVLGVGSYTFQGVTRDTFGFAAKAAYFKTPEISSPIYKDPITDDGTKKSLKGYQIVTKNSEGEYTTSACSERYAYYENNELETIFKNGNILSSPNFEELRSYVKQFN